ncbi:MAG: LptA/OstA family protein, partial [Pseudomonadota bacterium]
MSRNFTLLFVLLSGLTVGQLSHGLASDASKPVTIDADRATSNGISGVTTYSGNVLVKQGSMTLNSDTVTLITKKNKVTSRKASGKHVKLS